MEVVQGKQKDKKVVVAQEIAFAKVLAGNNKTLRDRAVKKLKKWLTVRGNGKWVFTEDEFLRIWTGLFYCMWMSDKFLVQEELAESISKLIHCFKKNSDTALLFIKCFNKRILMDWEGLDQYRIDKFNMLVRRFLRQTFVYCKEKNWDAQLLNELTKIFYDVLHKNCSLGFILHFIAVYPEELAKVSAGKLSKEIVLILVEPFVKLLARTREDRVQKEAEEFFNYLMRQTDTGIEFEEQFNAWREQGFPGEGPHCMRPISKSNGTDKSLENGNESFSEEDDDDEDDKFGKTEPLDPRAGSVHVILPQIPVDADGFIELFQKHIKAKQTTAKGKRMLKNFTQKYTTLKKGKFPKTIKKDPIIVESKKKKQTGKNAKKLLKFTQELNEGPIRTEEFEEMSKELEEQSDSDGESEIGGEGDETVENGTEKKISIKKDKWKKMESVNNKKGKKVKKKKKNGKNKLKNECLQKENIGEEEMPKAKKPKVKKKKKKVSAETIEDDVDVKRKEMKAETGEDAGKTTAVNGRAGAKRKILSNWQVQELDANSPEYFEIKTPKIIRIEKKVDHAFDWEGNEPAETLEEIHENPGKTIEPVFWEKAKAKAAKGRTKKGEIFKNPFAEINGGFKSPGSRRISFALEKNMAQENEEYLEEVKNSPKVPFDGSKKPVQSALKSGLAPSPVNPFYTFKKSKFFK